MINNKNFFIKNKFSIILLLIALFLCFGSAIYAKYILTREFNAKIETAPFYFEAEIGSSTIDMNNGEAFLNLTLKNNNMVEYNLSNIDYEISITGNEKINFSANDQWAISSKVNQTINGGSLLEKDIEIKFMPMIDSKLNSEEKLTLNIKSTYPYSKEFSFPITIYPSYASTLSGIEFNYIIKNGEYAPSGDIYEWYSTDANRMKDYTIKRIVFGKNSDYSAQINGITAEPVDLNRTGAISLYRKQDSTSGMYTIYILSQDGNFVLAENSAWMFDKLYELEDIVNLHLLDTSNVTNMRDMFCDCAVIKNIDLSNFETSNVTDMIGMFARNHELEYLDLSTFDVSSLEKFNQMFTSDENLKAIYVSDKWKLNGGEEESNVFAGCTSLIGGNGTIYDATKVAGNMAKVDGTTVGYLTNGYNFLPGIEVNHAIKNKTKEEIATWTESTRFSDTSITSITFGKLRDYFDKVDGYEPVAVDEERSGAIKIYRIPNGTSKYSVYIISNSGTFIANSDSSWMFDKLYFIETFYNFNLLDTSKVTKMRDMFCDCETLASLDLSNFNTQNVTSMQGMFARMYSIEILDLSSFNTKNVTTMLNMFQNGISSADTLDNFKNSAAILKTIYVSDLWVTTKENSGGNVFGNCVNLVGGAGTIFNSANLNITYARIDTIETPGYLTKK